MAAIKQVGLPVCEAIIKEREENGEFTSIFDFCKRIEPKYVNKKSLEGLIKAGAFSNIEKSRKQLFENIENILDITSKAAKDKEMGQVSLFGTDDSFNDVQYSLLGSNEEYSDKEIQQFEKEFLGFYVTSHPLFSIRDKMQYISTHRINELNNTKEEEVVTVCGLVTATIQIPTKKDPSKFLRFVTLEDLTGKIDAVCFNDKLKLFADILQPDMKLIITGKIQHRGENQLSLVVENVKPVDNANMVTLILKKEVKYEELCLIKGVLAKHHGNDPVIISIPEKDTDNTRIVTSPVFWVNTTNDFITDVKKVVVDAVDVDINSMDTPINA